VEERNEKVRVTCFWLEDSEEAIFEGRLDRNAGMHANLPIQVARKKDAIYAIRKGMWKERWKGREE
jgi:hypothetical protein